MTREYPIKTTARAGVLTVTEHADRIALALTFDRIGDFGDLPAILSQLRPLLCRYDRDPRPLVMTGTDTGLRAAIDVDDNGKPFAALTEETRQ